MSLFTRAGNVAGDLSLLLAAEKVAHSFMRGVHGRRRTGAGEAFWQFRPWQAGDARRDIDWRQSAKRFTTFVRQTEWEAAQTALLWRDSSASMAFGGKRDFADILLLALVLVLLNGGEQVGLLGAPASAQAGAGAAERILTQLPLQKDLSEGARPVPAGAQTVLISDFFMPLEDLRRVCESLARRRVAGILVQVVAPEEEDLPHKGHVRFENMEGAETLDISEVSALRDEYLQKFHAHRAVVKGIAEECGWAFETFRSDARPEAALAQLYERLAVR